MRHINEVESRSLLEPVRQERKSKFCQILWTLFLILQLLSCGKIGGGSSLGADWLVSLGLIQRSHLPHILHVPAGRDPRFQGLIGWKEITLISYTGSVQGRALDFIIPALSCPLSGTQYWTTPGMGALVIWLLQFSELDRYTLISKMNQTSSY